LTPLPQDWRRPILFPESGPINTGPTPGYRSCREKRVFPRPLKAPSRTLARVGGGSHDELVYVPIPLVITRENNREFNSFGFGLKAPEDLVP